jgi:hypothetical protein
MTVDIAMLSEAMKLYLHAMSEEPRFVRDIREDVYGTSAPDPWTGYWDMESDLIKLGLVTISLPIDKSSAALTPAGLEARALLLKDNSDAG